MSSTVRPVNTKSGFEKNPKTRVFLGWDGPVLAKVVDRLYSLYYHSGQWDMRGVLIVLPGGLAARRLTELLAIRAQQTRSPLYPPEMVTLGDMPERLYAVKFPIANDSVQTLAWSAALQGTSASDLKQVVPNPPAASATSQWMELAKIVANLHRELASDCLDFQKVAKALGKNHAETPRWNALSKIQRRYLDELHSLELWDLQTARLKALELSEPTTDREIVVVGCVDLNRVQRGFLAAVSEHVQIWIAAPETMAGFFDPLGCLEAEKWQGQCIDLPQNCLLVGNSPSDQAELVAASLAELGDKFHVRDVTLGVPDTTLIPELRYRLAQSDLRTRFGAGEPWTRSQPAILLAAISRYIEDRSYSSLAALVRHPIVEQMLEADRKHLPSDWLNKLDEYYQEVLPTTLDGFIREESKSAEVFRKVISDIDRWLKPLEGKPQQVARWAEPLRKVLVKAFSHVKPIDLPGDNGNVAGSSVCKLIDATKLICEWIAELEEIPKNLQPKLGLADLTDWLLQSIAGERIPEPPEPSSLEILGWLDLAWDDAPVLIIAGLHDGVVPESVNADAFLPNQLRRQLGMRDNARRLARDIYLLKLVQSSREHLRIVVGRVDSEGDPLVPSRLLLACDLADLPARVLHLVQGKHSDVLPTVERVAKPVPGASRLSIPQPKPCEPPKKINVTAFRDYLRCPYRFYLRHVLGLKSKSDAEVELDAAQFGNLVHYTLDKLAGSPVVGSTNADEIAEFLTEQLRQVALSLYGPKPPAPALIQIEQAQMRLSRFAVKQAARTAEGWQIRFTETGSTPDDRIMIGQNKELCLVGRIDRIDFHPESGQWAIWDYKTSEKAKNPKAVHYSQRDGWLDLQLPLYIPIARKLGVTGNPSVGYIALPKRQDDIDFYPADFDQKMLEEALAKADEVASKVAACEFWPQTLDSVEYDDFARICQVKSLQVHAAPPTRIMSRFDGYRSQRVDSRTVELARQRLENPPARTGIALDPLLIRASAGTGKTFQLTNRLLNILLAGHDVDGILATTFTRKAAGEILHRLLQRLAEGCISQKERQELARQLPGAECSAANCLATLRRVTASIHRLRIGTLDSFFSQLARTFSLDMGLPAGWTTMEPSREPVVQMLAISEMLRSHDHQTLLDLIRMLFKGESSRRVSEDIRLTVENGLSFYRSSTEEAWDRLPLRKPPDDASCESAIQTIQSCRFSDRRINNALEKLVAIFSEGDWEGVIDHGMVRCLKSEVPSYYRKELPSDLCVALEVLQDKAIAEILPIYRSQTLATFNVLQAYDLAYQSLVRGSRTLAFADVSHFLSQWLPTKLANSSSGSERSRLEYRLDCSVQHLLLDEFQDTSLEQWDILRPLAQPLGRSSTGMVKASEQSFFCVGDNKQAIYGWRGGEARIFDSVLQSIDGLKCQDLKKSFRSSPEIMQAVNEVFQNLDRHSNFSDCDHTAKSWQSHFPKHETEQIELKGYVLLENGPKLEDNQLTSEERRLMFLEHTVDRVAQLVEKSSASIGILVRKNDDVARIMALLRERHIAGSQDGGNPLTDSAAVELILSLVHLADHPGDTISLFHVLNSPLATAFPFSKEDSQQEIGRWFAQLVASIGLGQAIEWVSERLAEHLSWWDQQRVEQLILRAHEHGKTGGRLRDFEQFVESHRVALPSDAQVKVMTIHKSKGLEFDAVFLPSLDISLTESPPKLIARRPSPCEPPNGILRYVKEKLQGILPADWQQAFHEDKSTGVYESLCILYVAMTRAKRALYMTTCPAGKDPGRGLGSLLQSTLANGLEISKDANALLYSVGDPEWYADLPKSAGLANGRAAKDQEESSGNYQSISIRLSREKSKAPQSGLTLRAPSKAARGTGLLANLDKVAKSEDYGSSKVHLEVQTEFLRDALMESLATNHKASTAFGKLIHIWMAQIEWLDDFAMDHERLKQVAEAHLQSDELRYVSLPEAVSYFEKCLAQPSIRKCLSRANYSNKLGSQMSGRVVDEIDVENERPIRAVIEGQLVVGAIDRLIVLLANGTPVAAEVIDYKTDSPEDQPPLLWLNESLARHRPQLELYGRVVSELYGIDEGLVGKYLALLPTGDVISV